MLDDAVYHTNLQFVIKAVPYAAVSDFISTEAGHSSAFFVTAVAATEATLLSDERGLASSRMEGAVSAREVFRWPRRPLPDPSRPFPVARTLRMALWDFHWRS